MLDAGTTETGRPYFVMELVRGIPINEFCDGQRLTVRQRLELFLRVCQAVQHAHQKGIIHRDLKPTNVLVTKADTVPLPKVIDFGIAKALGPALTDHTLHTGFAQLVGTPMYMSPEQAEMNHLGVDTRSDVYSLGVLLYELLTGTPPFDRETLSKAGLDEMRRIIREDDPPRPSQRISTLSAQATSTLSQQRGLDERHLGRVLRAELDWIVMKALEKDRSRRYESASALAADIQRYLSDEPVLACPPTAMYRFQKFARKRKASLTTAAAIAICLLLGTTVSAWQAVRATTAEAEAKEAAAAEGQQRQRAEANEQKANLQRDEAQRQRDEIKALNETLQATQGELRRTLYAAHMNLAKHAWSANNFQQLSGLLNQHRPAAGQEDPRGFEWHYFNRLCHSEVLTLKGHSAVPNQSTYIQIAYSPGGKRLATAAGRDVKVWDVVTGNELFSYQIEGESTWELKYSPDGKHLAGAGQGGIVIWDSETGQQFRSIKHGDDSFAFSPDGKFLASGANQWDDKTKHLIASEVKVWDLQSSQELLSLRGGGISVTYSSDGKRLASSSYDGYIQVWETKGGQELLSLQSPGGASDPVVRFSPDGKLLAAAGEEDTRIWNAWTGELIRTLKDEGANNLAFSPTGDFLATAWSSQRFVNLWDPKTGQKIRTIRGPSDVKFSPDGGRLAGALRDNTVKIWDAYRDQEFVTVPTGGGLAFAFAPDWRRMVHSTEDNSLRVKDVSTGQEILKLDGHTIMVNCLAFSPDGSYVASGAGGRRAGSLLYSVHNDDKPEVKLWDAKTGRELFAFPMPSGAVWSITFSPDSKRLAAHSKHPPRADTAALKMWEVQTGRELLFLQGRAAGIGFGPMDDLTFSPDGKRLVCGNKIHDAETGQELFALSGGRGTVAYTPDGRSVAMWREGGITFWDAQSGKEMRTIKAGRGGGDLAFSPDGRRVATSAGKDVLLLDSQTGLEVLTLDREDHYLFNGLVFSPDGHRLACTGPDGNVRIYDATPLPEKP